MTYTEILNYELIRFGEYTLSVYQILLLVVIFAFTKLFVSIVRRFLRRIFKARELDIGRSYAVEQFTGYLIYLGALLVGLQTVGVSLTALLAGSAALLVGLGFGIQEFFKDFVSGILLLFEGSIEVGDVIKVDGLVAMVKKIGMRTTIVKTRDEVTIIIPNSKIVTGNVTNWTHEHQPIRFQVKVGVAYGSDTVLVTDLLLRAVSNNQAILKTPIPRVEFEDFQDSALGFVLHFYSKHFLESEFIKSEVRFEIDKLFRENNISIPFPQRDVRVIRDE